MYGELEGGNDRQRKTIRYTRNQRGIFQGDWLSPLIFAVYMMTQTLNLRKANATFVINIAKKNVDHLLFSGDQKC